MAKRNVRVACQFCQNGHHEHCPNIARGTSIQCVCGCSVDKCNLCKRRGDLDSQGGCVDVVGCEETRLAKVDQSPVVKLIRECREAAAAEKRSRYESNRIEGSCLCCGAVTSGGDFLPGHNIRWKYQQAKREEATIINDQQLF